MTNASVQKANSDLLNKALDAKAALGRDIRARWDRFSEIETGALRSVDDLVAQLVAKYSLDISRAQAEALALVNGRRF